MILRFTAFLSFLMVLSCGKPSSETMEKRWASTQEEIKEILVMYPSFRPVLEMTQQKAVSAWDIAQKESEPEKQVDMMMAAYDQLRQTYVEQLIDMPTKIDRLRDKITRSINTPDMNQFELNSLSTLRSEASYTITQVQSRLTNPQVRNEEEATLLLASLTNQIKDAQRGIEKLISSVKKRVRKEQKAEDDSKTSNTTDNSAPSSIKCSYCGSKNTSSKSTCSKCGAPLK